MYNYVYKITQIFIMLKLEIIYDYVCLFLDDMSNNSPINRLPQTNEYEEPNYLALLREFQADTKLKKKV